MKKYHATVLNIIFLCGTTSLAVKANDQMQQCLLEVNSCTYALQLLPSHTNSKHCQNVSPRNYFMDNGEQTFRRVKRSQATDGHHDGNDTGNKKKDRDEYFKGETKFERMVMKSLNQVSVRTLRGIRRIERQVAALSKLIKNEGEEKPKKCPTGFMSLDNWPSCYMFSTFDMSWYEAKDYCAAFDSDLTSLGTVREHYILTYFIKNDAERNKLEGWWTSGSFVSKTRQWMWTAQLYLRPFSFIKWAPTEPDEEDSQCMFLASKDDHLWNDDICTRRYNFVCEANAKTL